MINYIYDGSFEGLLTAIYESYYRHETPDNILPVGKLQQSFFDTNINIISSLQKSEKVLNAIKEKISAEALGVTIYIFLSEMQESGTIIYQYLNYGFKVGSKVHLHLADNRVLKAYNIWRKVAAERHRMLGLVRFRKLKGNVYYSPIEPDNNITGLIAPHFSKRMKDQDWIIHDVKRNIAALYDKKEWIVIDFTMNERPEFEKDELSYQKLWKQYFNDIAIKSKINPELQKRNMPFRYWKYLIEKTPNIL